MCCVLVEHRAEGGAGVDEEGAGREAGAAGVCLVSLVAHTTPSSVVKKNEQPNLPRMFPRKALESLAGREHGEPHRLREQAQRDMDALREAFNGRIAELEQVSQHMCF